MNRFLFGAFMGVVVTLVLYPKLVCAEYWQLDQPDPEAVKRAKPCFMVLSDGWDLLSLRNKGAKRRELEGAIKVAVFSDELKAARLRVLNRVWDAPGDGWEFIGDIHRACMKDFYAGKDTSGWY